MAVSASFIRFIAILVACNRVSATEVISLSKIIIKLDDAWSLKDVAHDISLEVIWSDLVYTVADGSFHAFAEIHFDHMAHIGIPCYVKGISFSVKLRDDRIAWTKPLSLLAVSNALYDSTLVVELFDRDHEQVSNGWLLVTSNDNQCVRDDDDDDDWSPESGISSITRPKPTFGEGDDSGDRDVPDSVSSVTPSPNASTDEDDTAAPPSIPWTASGEKPEDSNDVSQTDQTYYPSLQPIQSTGTTSVESDDADHETTKAATITTTTKSLFSAIENNQVTDKIKQLLVEVTSNHNLHNNNSDADTTANTSSTAIAKEGSSMVSAVVNNTEISVSPEHAIIANQTLVHVCVELVNDGAGVYMRAVDLQNLTDIVCIETRSYVDETVAGDGNHSEKPTEVSLFVTAPINDSAFVVLPGNVTTSALRDEDASTCEPIIIDLDWNSQREYSLDQHVPQCVYRNSQLNSHADALLLSHSLSSTNQDCIPIFHDDNSVKCACQSFGSYSTSVTSSHALNVSRGVNNDLHLDGIVISLVLVLLVVLCALMEPRCRSRACCFGPHIDEPLVSLEVYLPNKQRYRMWLLSREGGIHWILRHKFASGRNQCAQLACLVRHYMSNDSLLLPFYCRDRGSNHDTVQRILNLFWLIFAVLSIAMVVTCGNTDVNPSYCEHAEFHHSTAAFTGTRTFCTRKYEIAVCILCAFLLCVCHFVHQVVCQLIHPNKLQMDLHALALMELKRFSKRRRSTNFMAMKIRFSKTTKTNSENFGSEGHSSGLQSVWQNVSKWGRTVADSYQRKLSAFTLLNRGYNDKDVYIAEQYLFELETRRHSILEQTAGVAGRGYYFESTHNDSMIELDYNYAADDVDDDDKHGLGLLDVNVLENSHGDADNDSEEDDDVDVLLNDRVCGSEAMKQLEECEESESSVTTAVVSSDHEAGSKRPSLRSNSSQTVVSVNSLSRSTDKAPGKHDARLSVSVHENDENDGDDERKAEGHKQRGLSYSLQFQSPNDATRRNMTRAEIAIQLDGASTVSPPPKISFDTPSRVHEAVYGDNATHSYKSFSAYSINGSDAPQPPSPLREYHNGVTPTPPPTISCRNNDEKFANNKSTIFVQDEDSTGKAFYVHCGTPSETGNPAVLAALASFGGLHRHDDSGCSAETFIAKTSASEGEDEDDELEEELSTTQTFACVDNAENMTHNVSKESPAAAAADEVCKTSHDSAVDSSCSTMTMDSAVLSMTMTVASADFDSLPTPSSAAGVSMHVACAPTQPSMSAPQPMMRRRHSYGGSHSRSRTDLDASGDETTSGSDDNDALASSSGGGGADHGDMADMYDEAELVCSPFGERNANSSQGSTPSPIKHVAPRSDDIYNELQQRKSAMDQHYCVPHRYRAYTMWYFGVCIAVMASFLVFAGPIALDQERKYASIPNYRHRSMSFLSEACRNHTHFEVDSYLMHYGHEFVDTTYYARNTDAVHWLLLSVISVSAMLVVYPLMLVALAGCMMYRYRYYQRHSVDPAFLCKCCPVYQRYSSPNAPNLTAILDPNNLYFFNHTTSSNASPNRGLKTLATVPDNKAMRFEHDDDDGVATGDELDHVVNSEEEHVMGREPPSPMRSGDDNDGHDDTQEKHVRVLSDVLRETLLLQPVSIPLSPNHNVSENVIVEELDEDECRFMD